MDGDFTLGTPAIKPNTDQSTSNEGVNSTIVITGVEARNYKGTATRDYRRVPLSATVLDDPGIYDVAAGAGVAGLFAVVAPSRNWHPALQYTTTPSSPNLGATGTTGTITFVANPADPLHIGSQAINYRVV